MIEKSELEQLVDKGLTQCAIADILKCSISTVKIYLAKYDLKTKAISSSCTPSIYKTEFNNQLSDEKLIELVNHSHSFVELYRYFHIENNTARQLWLRERMNNLNIDTSHFKLNSSSYLKENRTLTEKLEGDFEWHDDILDKNPITGIYVFINKLNSNRYIGQAIDIKARCSAHLRHASNPNDPSYDYPLHRAIRKYGLSNFEIHVLCECHENELNAYEHYFIHLFDTYHNGYNATPGGDARNWNLNERLEMSGHKDEILGCIDDLTETELTYETLSKKWSLSVATISDINNGNRWRQPNLEYPLRASHIYKVRNGLVDQQNKCLECGKPLEHKGQHCQTCYDKIVKRQARERLEKNVGRDNLADKLKTKTFVEIGDEYGVGANTVKKWCKILNLPAKRSIIKMIPDELWSEIIGNYDNYKEYYERLDKQENTKRRPEYVVSLFKSGLSITKITKKCHLDDDTVKRILNEKTPEMLSKYLESFKTL